VLPTFCLCEVSCYAHNDCCDDIVDICIPDHLKPVSPAPLWSVNITFHTATLLWRVPAEAALNDTYAVVYWEYDNPNVTLVHDTSVEIGFVESLMKTTIVGLVSGVLYEWSVEARNEITSVQSVTSNFTTVHYAMLEEFKVQLYNTSAVLVSWQHPQLPFGVRLQHYIVHYARSKISSPDEASTKSMSENYGVIGGLQSDTYYHFWIEAIFLEMDGRLQSTVVVSANASVFVPGIYNDL
jgi:hypothetical protein